MFLYLFYAIILVYVIIAPAISVVYPDQIERFYEMSNYGFKAIPDAMWAVFWGGYGLYGVSRTVEKIKGVA